MLRLLPILKWNFQTVWSFIRECNIEYCSLYDQGYTEVGDRVNSIVNPFLEGGFAYRGNENVEHFSRTQIYNKIRRKEGKIVFDVENVKVCLRRGDSVQED